MTTATRRVARQGVWTDKGTLQLQAMLSIIFLGDEVPLARRIDKGFRIRCRIDRAEFTDEELKVWARLQNEIPGTSGRQLRLDSIARMVHEWLKSLDEDDKQVFCGGFPSEEAYAHNPHLTLDGWTLSKTCRDEIYDEVTIVPAWV